MDHAEAPNEPATPRDAPSPERESRATTETAPASPGEDPKKILVLASTLNLSHRLGCTPQWWQLLKAFREQGHEVVAIPYLGDPVESPWWRTHENPLTLESKIMNRVTDSGSDRVAGRQGLSKRLSKTLIKHHVRPTWTKHLEAVLDQEQRDDPVDLVLMLNIPLNHINGLPTRIREEYGVRVAYWDGDLPTILPEFAKERGFKFDYYEGAQLGEYDAFFSNSKGAIPALEQRGATNVHPLYWAVDPHLFHPLDIDQDIDVAFYGHGDEMRKDWIDNLITQPSRSLPHRRFVVGGEGFTMDLGDVHREGVIPYSAYDRFVSRAKINVNATRRSHADVYASATTRPFELAAYGACVVSQPTNGIEEWFTPGEDLLIVESAEEAQEAYEQLLDEPERRSELGRNAREAVLDRHTFHHRARRVLRLLPAR